MLLIVVNSCGCIYAGMLGVECDGSGVDDEGLRLLYA